RTADALRVAALRSTRMSLSAGAAAMLLILGVSGSCTTETAELGPYCGDDLADVNRDGKADEVDCILKESGRAEKATCELVAGLWWSQSRCASEATKDVPGFVANSPWEQVRALSNGSIAVLRPEGLTVVAPRTGVGGLTEFRQSAPVPDFGDRITSVGGVDEIAVSSFTRAWYDKNSDSVPTADEVVDLAQLGRGAAWRVQVLRIDGHAAAAVEVQGAVNAWQDLDDDLVVDPEEVISFLVSRFIGMSHNAIYFSRLNESFEVSTEPWTADPSRVRSSSIANLCQALVPGSTTVCISTAGYLIDAIDGHRLSSGAYSSDYRQERYLVGRRFPILGPQGQSRLWFDLNADNVEQTNEVFARSHEGTSAAFDASIDFGGLAEEYGAGASGVTMTFGPTGSADTLKIVAWRRFRARRFAGEPCINAEQCPIGYVCERNGTSSESCCVMGAGAAP
ncbi:MAG: hypothetical protein KA201_24535, partial [Kofleriaceae bacterium]|nr:hypothetical protein [Kofleriaceae bacterium]